MARSILNSVKLIVIFTIALLATSNVDEKSFKGPLVLITRSNLIIEISKHKYLRFHIDDQTLFRKNGLDTSVSDIARFGLGDIAQVNIEPYQAVPRATTVTFVSAPSASEYALAAESPTAANPRNLLHLSAGRPYSGHEENESLFSTKLPPLLTGNNDDHTRKLGIDGFIEDVKDRARAILADRPNYIVKRISSRFSNISSPAKWDAQDVLEAEVLFENGLERNRSLRINGKSVEVAYGDARGSKTTGELAGVLQTLIGNGTRFSAEGFSQIDGRQMRVYSYSTSANKLLESGFVEADASDAGRLWIDPITKELKKIESTRTPLINDFLIVKMEEVINFADVWIGNNKTWLPTSSDAIYWVRRPTPDALVRTIFRDYQKFEAESSIKFK